MIGYFFETEEHLALRNQVRRFAAEHIAPHARRFEEEGEFPRDLYRLAGAHQLLGVGFPEALGGAGGDITHAIVVGEEMIVSGHSVGVAVGLGSLAIGLPPVVHHGRAALRNRVVPEVLRGEKISALAVTEPAAGSDVAAISTRARREGDRYVVSGSKTFITSGTRADYVTTAVRTGAPGHGGISLLVIDASAPGYQVGRRLDKMGWWASDTAELFFDEVSVPAENLLGEENEGFAIIMGNFVTERLLLASQAVAIMELAYREAVTYVRERRAFGRPVMGFQVTRHKLADMATRIAAARALTGEVAMRLRQGQHDASLAAKAKNTATDALLFVVHEAVQLHGGAGYMREVLVERLYRDARLYPIGGGTREIMNEVIAKLEGY